jgi:hypothetical protein
VSVLDSFLERSENLIIFETKIVQIEVRISTYEDGEHDAVTNLMMKKVSFSYVGKY